MIEDVSAERVLDVVTAIAPPTEKRGEKLYCSGLASSRISIV